MAPPKRPRLPASNEAPVRESLARTIGVRIAEARKGRMTSAELATHLGVTRGTLSTWENGKSLPDLFSLMAVAKLAGKTIDQMIYVEGPAEAAMVSLLRDDGLTPPAADGRRDALPSSSIENLIEAVERLTREQARMKKRIAALEGVQTPSAEPRKAQG